MFSNTAKTAERNDQGATKTDEVHVELCHHDGGQGLGAAQPDDGGNERHAITRSQALNDVVARMTAAAAVDTGVKMEFTIGSTGKF